MQEYDSLRMNLDLKEKELSDWDEKLNAREKVCSFTCSFASYVLCWEIVDRVAHKFYLMFEFYLFVLRVTIV